MDKLIRLQTLLSSTYISVTGFANCYVGNFDCKMCSNRLKRETLNLSERYCSTEHFYSLQSFYSLFAL